MNISDRICIYNRHVSSADRVGKRYRNMASVFSIGDEDGQFFSPSFVDLLWSELTLIHVICGLTFAMHLLMLCALKTDIKHVIS